MSFRLQVAADFLGRAAESSVVSRGLVLRDGILILAIGVITSFLMIQNFLTDTGDFHARFRSAEKNKISGPHIMKEYTSSYPTSLVIAKSSLT